MGILRRMRRLGLIDDDSAILKRLRRLGLIDDDSAVLRQESSTKGYKYAT